MGELDVVVERDRQLTDHDAAEHRADRPTDQVVRHQPGLDEPLHGADVDEARPASAAEHQHQALAADLGIQLRLGEVAAMVLDHPAPLLVHLLLELEQRVASAGQPPGRQPLFAQRSGEDLDDPLPPAGELVGDVDVAAARVPPAGPAAPGSKTPSRANEIR